MIATSHEERHEALSNNTSADTESRTSRNTNIMNRKTWILFNCLFDLRIHYSCGIVIIILIVVVVTVKIIISIVRCCCISKSSILLISTIIQVC